MSARSEARVAKLQEAAERIADPEGLKKKLDHLHPSQSALMMKLYRSSRFRLTGLEIGVMRNIAADAKAGSEDVISLVSRVFADMGGDKWNLADVKRSGHYRHLVAMIDRRIAALNQKMRSTLQAGLLDQFKTTLRDNRNRFQAVKSLGAEIKTKEDDASASSMGINFDMAPDVAVVELLNEPWSGADFSSRLGLITDEMAQNVKSIITRSMMNSESWQQTARGIRGEMGTSGTASVWRAEMIARTEIARAQSLANQVFAEENADIVEDQVWVSHPGACPICASKDQRSVDEVGYPPEDSHPNCVCDTIAVPKSSDEIINGT